MNGSRHLHGREDAIQPLHLRRPALRGRRRQSLLATTAANQRRELESSGYQGPKGPGRVSIPSGGRGVGRRFSGGVNHRVTNPACEPSPRGGESAVNAPH